MDQRVSMTTKAAQYTTYPELEKTLAEQASTEKTQPQEKQPRYDYFESAKEESWEEARIKDQLERIRTTRFGSDNKAKQKVKHNAGSIRAKMMVSSNTLMVRMALSEAYREKAAISMSLGNQNYDSKDAAKAMAQIKKVISAGKLKISNLTKEERKELAVKRAKKKMKAQQVQEERRKLAAKRRYNRLVEERTCANVRNGGQENEYLERLQAEARGETTTYIPGAEGTGVTTGEDAADIASTVVGGSGADGVATGGADIAAVGESII